MRGERAGGVTWTAEDFNDKAEKYFSSHGVSRTLTLTDEELGRIRARVRELGDRWKLLPRGETLELVFS